MHRQTARILLVLLLVGLFAPVALAITADSPHACCLRKTMHDCGSHEAAFHAPPGCCQHDCCRPLTVSHWAQLRPPADAFTAQIVSSLPALGPGASLPAAVDHSHSGRAPPLA